jgi:hypothetical protein
MGAKPNCCTPEMIHAALEKIWPELIPVLKLDNGKVALVFA